MQSGDKSKKCVKNVFRYDPNKDTSTQTVQKEKCRENLNIECYFCLELNIFFSRDQRGPLDIKF